MKRLAYSIKEVCQLLGLGRATVYRRISDRTLKVRKVGGRTLVPASEIARLVGDEETEAEDAEPSLCLVLAPLLVFGDRFEAAPRDCAPPAFQRVRCPTNQRRHGLCVRTDRDAQPALRQLAAWLRTAARRRDNEPAKPGERLAS